MSTTPAGFEPARAEHSSLAGCRLNHSAKVSRDDKMLLKYSATGNRTPGICVTGRDVTNYTIADHSYAIDTLDGIRTRNL